jgi:hypothetical protein
MAAGGGVGYDAGTAGAAGVEAGEEEVAADFDFEPEEEEEEEGYGEEEEEQ